MKKQRIALILFCVLGIISIFAMPWSYEPASNVDGLQTSYAAFYAPFDAPLSGAILLIIFLAVAVISYVLRNKKVAIIGNIILGFYSLIALESLPGQDVEIGFFVFVLAVLGMLAVAVLGKPSLFVNKPVANTPEMLQQSQNQ